VLYALLHEQAEVRLFGYISFRMAMAALTAFVLALWWGKHLIRWLRARGVREDVSKAPHAELVRLAESAGKGKTPTMGGTFLVAALVASVCLWARLDNLQVVLGVFLVAGLCAVGFVDDYKKLVVPGCRGLSSRAKMLGLSAVTLGVLGVLCWYARTTGRASLLDLYAPVLQGAVLPLSAWGLAGIALFLLFEWLVVVGASNAVNIVDGMDGLAAGCAAISGAALLVLCYVTGRADWTGYLGLPHVPQAAEMAVVGAALCGAALGFLWYNAFPAQVFMGDSGSLPLGGALAWLAVVAKQELALPLVCGVFVLDLATSFLQTFWFKRTRRRLFTMAPIHHGLQRYGGVFAAREHGWHEAKVVVRFWILAACGATASLALLKLR
jgi:phospho-N-acetylmuramoyl-pentapeptide-transferase